jgi:hypothetical protein
MDWSFCFGEFISWNSTRYFGDMFTSYAYCPFYERKPCGASSQSPEGRRDIEGATRITNTSAPSSNEKAQPYRPSLFKHDRQKLLLHSA